MKAITYEQYMEYKEKVILYAKQYFELKLERDIFIKSCGIMEQKPHDLSDSDEDYNFYTDKESKVYNRYDKSFRKILQDKEEAIGIINKVTGKEGDITPDMLEDLALYNSNYINALFENEEADIVYELKDTNIFFLIEHQSKIDYKMPIRVLRYSAGIMELAVKYMNFSLMAKSPIVIPIVIYTGKKKWDAMNHQEECKGKLYTYEKVGVGEYNIIDINNFSKEELLQDDLFITKALILVKSNNKQEFIQNSTAIIEKGVAEKNWELLTKLISFLSLEKLSKEEQRKLMNKISKKDGKQMVIEVLEKEYEKGINQGIENIVIQMIKNNFEDNVIIQLTQITQEELEKIKKKIEFIG